MRNGTMHIKNKHDYYSIFYSTPVVFESAL